MLSSRERLPYEVESCQHFHANHRAGFDSSPWKRNQDVVVFQYTCSGLGRVQFENVDLPQREGDAFLIRTEPNHRYFLPETSEAWEFISFTFLGEGMITWAKRMIREHGIHYRFSADSPVVNSLYALYQRVSRDVMMDPFSLSAQSYQLIMHIQQEVETGRVSDEVHPRIQRAIRLIHEQYREPLDLERIAAECELSPFYLSRRFKAQTGSTLRNYLEQVRIQRAKQYLLDVSMPVVDVAARVGFSEQAYFSNVFRKCVGVSPSEFRKSSRVLGPVPFIT